MLNSQIILQTVWQDLIDQNTSQFKVLFKLFSEFGFVLVRFEWIGVGIGEIDVVEEIEETLGLDQLGDHSLLACFLVLLLLLDFLESQVLADPFDKRGFRLDRSAVLQVELLGELSVLDDWILSEREDNSEVVSSFLVDNVNVVDGVQQLLIVLAK